MCRKRSCLPLSKSMLYLGAPVRAQQIFRIFCVTALTSLCTHYSGCVGRDLSGQEDEDPNRPVSSYGGRPHGCCNPPMSGPGGRPSGCGLCGVKCTGQYQSPEESPSASSIAGGLNHPGRAWQSSWQLCQSRLQFPVNASTKGGGPDLRPQNLRWQRFLAGRKRRCRAGMKNDIPGAGRRARAARRLAGSLPACFRHRGPTVGPRPQAVPHDCCKNCCDPSVSGPGCRPSSRGHMSLSSAVGKSRFPEPDADRRVGQEPALQK